MTFEDYLGPDAPVFEITARDRWGALDELVTAATRQAGLTNHVQAEIMEAVRNRESAMSTGIGFGIALPHATTDILDRPLFAVGVAQNKIPFEAIDRAPVDLLLLVLVPKGTFRDHMDTVAKLAKLSHRRELRQHWRRRFGLED